MPKNSREYVHIVGKYVHCGTCSVFNLGQNFKTRVSGSLEKKPGKTRVFSGFEINAILSDENSV